MRAWALEEKFVQKNLMGGLCTRKNWVWCAHKLLGIPLGLTTDTNLHSTFVAWLEQEGKHETLRILGYLGPLVGDRFWANYFNTACLYAIRKEILLFLSTTNMHILTSKDKTENNHMQTVLLFCCNQMKCGDDRDRNMALVMCKVQTMGIIHIIIM